MIQLGLVYGLQEALVALVVDGKPGVTHPAEILLYAMGAVSTAAAFLLLVWRLVKPHVDRYVTGIRQDLAVVREEVGGRNGGSTLKDSSYRTERAILDLMGEVHAVSRQVDGLDLRSRTTADTLDRHVVESRKYLSEAADALRDQGVTLPEPPAGDNE